MDEIEIDPRIESIVWRGLGIKSVRQIAEETGLNPDQIFAIKRELMEAVDVLTISERRQKLLVMMESMAHDALERAKGASDEFAAGLMNAARGAMKDSIAELARMAKADDGKIEALNAMRVRELMRLIEISVMMILGTERL